jgi:hypothetical protein
MIGSDLRNDLLMDDYEYTAPDLLRYFNTVAKLLLFDFLMLLADWYDVNIRIL